MPYFAEEEEKRRPCDTHGTHSADHLFFACIGVVRLATSFAICLFSSWLLEHVYNY